MRISFITTVFNEESTIIELLISLYNQTILPDEIIVVDGGSTDKTIEKIASFPIPHTQKNVNIKLIVKKGNRSVGRNTAIAAATGNIILVSDAGCILDKNWVKNIIKPFEDKNIDVVSGYYKSLNNNIFEACLQTYMTVMPDKIDKNNFLPSSRSVAFRKREWEKVGGYPEDLDTCEDLIFDKKLKTSGAVFFFQAKAIVYWKQRSNIFGAAKQFFLYAVGDGRAHYFRKHTPLLFLRYLIGLSLLSISIQFFHTLISLVTAGFIFYTIWAIYKNYKYIKHPLAFFWLPILQLVSDIAVISGTSIGLIQSIKLLKLIRGNKLLTILIVIYSLVTLRSITWGIPNNAHPFTYHMDEWAESQSIRALFKHGTPNISGASHGAIFQYLLSGIYLIPFILLGIVNPFIIKSPFTHIPMQQMLFELLRINTLLFGIGSIIMIAVILKKYWKINPFFSTVFFAITPLWLILSNYFKYDIALVFWMLVAIYYIFSYVEKPSIKNFLIAGFFSGLTLATKLSAFPLFFVYEFSSFLAHFSLKKREMFFGTIMYVCTFLVLGIPDFIISHNEYIDWWNVNTSLVPSTIKNMIFEKPFGLYLWWDLNLGSFGHTFYIIFLFSFIAMCLFLIKKFYSIKKYKKELLICISLFLFAMSLIPLKIFAFGNRMLVLLPFFAILAGIWVNRILQVLKPYRRIIILILLLIIVYQAYETTSWINIRISPDPREVSSLWIKNNISAGTVIGIENVPIFQMEPDIILKEFYMHQYNIPTPTRYFYKIVDVNTKSLPRVIIVTNDREEITFMKSSQKKELVYRLQKEGYKKIMQFYPNYILFNQFNSWKIFAFPLLLTPDTITIYEKIYAKK